MWIIVIIVVIVFLFIMNKYFIISSVIKKIKSNGGMLTVYNTLVEGILEDRSAKVLGVGDNSINLGVTNIDGSTIFRILQLFDKVTVEWKVSSTVFGQHSLRWEFPNGLDQKKMLSTITSHIKEYNQKHFGIQTPTQNDYDNEIISRNFKMKNLRAIASNFNCEVYKAKKVYFNKMDELNSTAKDLDQLFYHLSNNMINEAKREGMNPKETQSGILYNWTKEYSDRKRIKTTAFDIDIISKLYDSNASLLIELIEAQKIGDINKFERLLEKHPEHIDLFISLMADHAKVKDEYDDELPF